MGVPVSTAVGDRAHAFDANSIGVNVSRAVGPAPAGVVAAGLGMALSFWLIASWR